MFLTHLECSKCHAEYSAGEVHNVCASCGKPLLARYDLQAIGKRVSRDDFAGRDASLWRYRELLPVAAVENVVTFGEGYTPILPATRTGEWLGLHRVFIKDEGQMPTGSFKARGMAVAVSKAKELGVTKVAAPSAGNAASALAAYGTRAGMDVNLFMPADTPEICKKECIVTGSNTVLVNGLINDCGKIIASRKAAEGWFDFSTLKEPYRAEGKKTMGLELAEQFGWKLPDVVIYPTGGGTGVVGMWKAFEEMEELGWIDSRRPRFVCVQSTGCAPIVKAFDEGKTEAALFPNAQTLASGIRVPVAIADFLILDAIYQSNGTAIAVTDDEILAALHEVARREGLFVCPEGAATVAALRRMVETNLVSPDETVVLFNTGMGIKYPEVVACDLPVIAAP